MNLATTMPTKAISNARGVYPKVGIVVVNYRTPEQTIDAVRSLQGLNYPNYEIILVENASGDDSAHRFQQLLPNVTLVIAQENGGYTAGNNLGIKLALERGADFVHVVNPDILVMNPDYLHALVTFMEENPDVAIVGPRVHIHEQGNVQNTVLGYPWLWRRFIDWFRYKLSKPKPRSAGDPVEAEVLNGVCILMSSASLREVGLFDESTFAYVEDVDWAYRADKFEWRRVYLPIDSILHLQKKSGYERASTVDFLLKRNGVYFLLKTGHWLQAAGYTLATLVLAGWYLARQLIAGRPLQPTWRWVRGLARAYVGLWTGRWEQVMGRPKY